MKSQSLLPLAALALAVAGCNKSNQATEKRLAELEQQNRDALARQQQLERELADQQLAAERDAVARERQLIEDERFALEQAKSADAEAKRAALDQRDQELAKREGKLESLESTLQDKERDLDHRDTLLSGRELELAGREPLPGPAPEVRRALPVADFGMFYDSLAAYGSWFSTPTYGYVWQPAIVRSPNWRPYWDGRWVCTDSGWTWLSNEPFGWACYHYGRWTLLRGHGWVWIPGDQWAPAWVCWRESGTHIGWAPLPPETMGWRDCRWDATVETRFGIGSGWFTFVSTTHFGSPIRSYCAPIIQNTVFCQQTVNITNIHCRNNHVFVGGPRYQNVCRTIGRPVPYYKLDLDHGRRPGRDIMAMRPHMDKDRLTIAAPDVGAAWNASLRPTRVRQELATTVVDRPAPIAADVTDQFRRQRELDQAQAEREMTRLGGREGFNRRRTEELTANQRQLEAQAARTPRPQPATPGSPGLPDQPRRPDRPERQPDRQPGGAVPDPGAIAGQPGTRPQPEARPSVEPPTRPQVQPNATAGITPVTPATPVSPAPDRQTRPDRPQRPDRPTPGVTDPTPAQPADPNATAAAEAAREQQAEAMKAQQAQQAAADRQRAAEAAREQQAEAMKTQQAQQTAADRQRAAEAAREQQAEAMKAQRDQQAEVQRQRAAEAAREQQAEAARERQAAAMRAQQEQQAEAQRQRAAEAAREQQEAMRRQQQEAQQRQMEEARQRQMEEARRQQQEAQQRQMEEARQRQMEEARRQQQEAQQRQQQEAQQRQQEEARRQLEEQQRRQQGR